MKQRIVLISCRFLIVVSLFLFGCAEEKNEKHEKYEWKSIQVEVSAYNSFSWQTDDEPNIAAWNNRLTPGMKCIAVSRDLIALGLDNNTQVKIKGLPGIYLVKDKMNRRYSNKIDIFMGKDVTKAKKWGNKKLMIQYRVKKAKDKKKLY